jgi:hypothetical protein
LERGAGDRLPTRAQAIGAAVWRSAAKVRAGFEFRTTIGAVTWPQFTISNGEQRRASWEGGGEKPGITHRIVAIGFG